MKDLGTMTTEYMKKFLREIIFTPKRVKSKTKQTGEGNTGLEIKFKYLESELLLVLRYTSIVTSLEMCCFSSSWWNIYMY